MKKLFNRFAAVTASAVLAAMSLCAMPGSATAEEEPAAVTITFDYSGEGITTEDAESLAPVTVSAGSAFVIPEGSLELEDKVFRGWTLDDIHGFVAGDVFTTGTEDVTFHPVWSTYNDKTRYDVLFYVEIDGEAQDTESLDGYKLVEGAMFSIPLLVYNRNDAVQIGWTDGETEFRGQERYIMHDHEVTFTPVWRPYRNLTYSAGDYDRIVGKTEVTYERIESFPVDLADGSTFVRSGFKLAGWNCDYDGQDYKFFAKFIIPDCDVTFTAIWEPIEVSVSFRMGSGLSAKKITIQGLTDSTIIVPEPTVEMEGMKFAGWQYKDEIYQPGDEFVIPTGVTLDALYVEDTEPVTETTTSEIETTTSESETTTTVASAGTVYGDANEDGKVNMADAVYIMQVNADPGQYKLSEQGKKNADVAGNGDGVTNNDALAIQQFEAGLVPELPVA